MPDLIGLLVARDITGSGSPGACFLFQQRKEYPTFAPSCSTPHSLIPDLILFIPDLILFIPDLILFIPDLIRDLLASAAFAKNRGLDLLRRARLRDRASPFAQEETRQIKGHG